MSLRFRSFPLVALWLLSSQTLAQIQISLYTGQVATPRRTVLIHQPSLGTQLRLENVSFQDRSFEPPLYYGVRAEYFWAVKGPRDRSQPKFRLGLGVDFVHFKVFADTNKTVRVGGTIEGVRIDRLATMSEFVQQLSISHGVNFLTPTFGFDWPIRKHAPHGRARNRLTVYAGAGVGIVIAHPETRVRDVSDEHYETHAPAFQFFSGTTLQLTRHLGLFAEYKFTRAAFDLRIDRGTAHLSLNSHHLGFGPTLRF